MYVRQLYTSCLSEAAYYVESNGEAAIIDPLRDIDTYISLAKERNATIKYIFETHFHADFVSGHIDLGKATGAPIIYGPKTVTDYLVHVANDGEVFTLGSISLTAMYTPGHTIESTCWLLKNEDGKNHAVFTGDTLFIGDVGRPDLSSGNLDSIDLAGLLYDSITQKILTLEDDVIVYPAHGSGSACGKNLGSETISTIGEQKATNYALQQPSKEAFIEKINEGLDEAPRYFAINARINKEGYESLDSIIKKGTTPLAVETFKKKMAADEDIIVVDTRPSDVFMEGFVPGTISIGLDGRFAEWAGSLLPFDKPMLLVCEPGKEEESVIRLARVGFDKMEGFLEGGFDAWQKAGETIDLIIEIEADEFAMDLPHDDNLVVVDVRNESEYASGHVDGAVNLPLKDMNDPGQIAMLPENGNLYLHCAGGYRSIIAASLLKREGLHNIRNIQGGWNAIKEQKGIKTVKESSVLN
jgi:glyoxylase-like metal-dependent hydrolase (beta-lactamase superfamily II)/rhodanese-related sulfurtransferase